jgi:uncharacterized repeat protein (TIGR03803 family)
MQTKRQLLFSVSLLCAFCAATAIASPAQTLTTLANFDGSDGNAPRSNLVQATDGNFYGTTIFGGSGGCDSGANCGTVFKITPSGTLTTLYQFSGTDGALPNAGLVQGSDGNFYGTTVEGGAHDGNGCPPTGGLWHSLQNHSKRRADHALQLLSSKQLHRWQRPFRRAGAG